MRDLIKDLRDIAENKDYKFIYGPRAILNIQYTLDNYDVDSVIFALFPVKKRSQSVSNSIVTGWVTDLTFLIGRKFDDKEIFGSDQIASLDETYQQKYDRRLFFLNGLVMDYIKSIICESDINVLSVNIQDQINDSDEVIDFVRCELTISYDDI